MNDSSFNNLNPLKQYIGALIENLDKTQIPKEIDLVLDGGAFNGGFGYGIVLYLKELEKLNLLKINRISGCSVGALLAVAYCINKLDSNLILYKTILQDFRETCFLNKLADIIRNFINNTEFDIEILNDKLYITYYNTYTFEQEVISKYKNKEELIESLIRTSYIPYLIDKKLQYNEKYIDGISPYIFPNSQTKKLFINLTTYKKLGSVFYIKNEVNVWPRLFAGILDINTFFSNSNSNSLFCSYINDWTIIDHLYFQSREILAMYIIIIIKLSLFVHKKIPENNKYYQLFQKISINLYKYLLEDFMI